ncbi:MAG: nicotinate (nicotinamide) nucleotide adenylyltransferase [Nitrospirae bacterium]|nr:nicotinate (nicotinamide) nucleotide adenylyltransferase [Nitrospirota bacterium]
MTGILGGTFNPVHFGHLRAAEEVRTALGLDSVIFIPASRPPHKTEEIADASHRMNMVRAAISGHPAFSASDIEIKRPDISYSVNTLEELRRLRPGHEFCFILGMDAFLDLASWKSPERVVSLADIAVITRPPYRFAELAASPFLQGFQSDTLAAMDSGGARAESVKMLSGRSAHIVPVTAMDISSTAIRRIVKSGGSIRYLLPEAVESYILFNKLYQ